jgi:hypothetical protein
VKEPVKVGIICECGPQGAEVQVFPELARRIDASLEIDCVPLDQKPRLIRECGRVAANLLAQGCNRVAIVWDLYPAWRERKSRPCRREDRLAIHESLSAAQVDSERVKLICIREELEAWMIADGRAVSAVLSTPAHRVRVKDGRNPEAIRNPKKRLGQIFQQHTSRQYSDRQHAIAIARALPDLGRLTSIPAFARFRALLLENG